MYPWLSFGVKKLGRYYFPTIDLGERVMILKALNDQLRNTFCDWLWWAWSMIVMRRSNIAQRVGTTETVFDMTTKGENFVFCHS